LKTRTQALAERGYDAEQVDATGGCAELRPNPTQPSGCEDYAETLDDACRSTFHSKRAA
jgi:hypothetical protein